MSKKRSSKSVILTIIITLIVLGCLTFAGIRFLLPAYTNGPNGDVDVQYKIYEIAVKVFPLLVGVVLIVIASMIANSRDDEEDEEDKLPPNSYDKQLFEAPADDPSAQKPAEETVTPEENEQFFSIFDSQETPKEEPAPEEAAEPAAEETAATAEPAEEEAGEEAPAPAAVAAAAPSASDAPVVDAIYALVNKLDEMTDMMSYEEEEHDQDDYEKYSTDEYPEEEYYEEGPSPLEEKIDKLCDAISNLATIVTNQSARPVVVAAAPEAAPAKAPVEAPAEKPAEKPAPAKSPKTEPVIKTVEVPVDQEINSFDATDPIQRARIEYDSAKEGFYDITYAITKADVNSVLVSLAGTGDAFEINGRTVAIIPFLSKAEAVEELDKIGSAYDIIFVDGDDNSSFDDVIAPNL